MERFRQESSPPILTVAVYAGACYNTLRVERTARALRPGQYHLGKGLFPQISLLVLKKVFIIDAVSKPETFRRTIYGGML